VFFKHTSILLLLSPIFNLPLAIPIITLYARGMQYLALTLPGGKTISAPGGVPTGGLSMVSKIIGNFITIMLIVTVILTLVFLIWGGVQWVQSGGDKQKLASARSRLTYAIIGLVVALLSFAVISIVGSVFNVNIFKIG
jgi:hypothetical protein